MVADSDYGCEWRRGHMRIFPIKVGRAPYGKLNCAIAAHANDAYLSAARRHRRQQAKRFKLKIKAIAIHKIINIKLIYGLSVEQSKPRRLPHSLTHSLAGWKAKMHHGFSCPPSSKQVRVSHDAIRMQPKQQRQGSLLQSAEQRDCIQKVHVKSSRMPQ